MTMGKVSTADEAVIVRRPQATPSKGTAGLDCHLGGTATTVSSVANATGDIASDKFIKPDIK